MHRRRKMQTEKHGTTHTLRPHRQGSRSPASSPSCAAPPHRDGITGLFSNPLIYFNPSTGQRSCRLPHRARDTLTGAVVSDNIKAIHDVRFIQIIHPALYYNTIYKIYELVILLCPPVQHKIQLIAMTLASYKINLIIKHDCVNDFFSASSGRSWSSKQSCLICLVPRMCSSSSM